MIAHLRQNCKFEFQRRLRIHRRARDVLSRHLLCRLTLKAGSSFKSKKNSRTLTGDAEFRLLYRPKLGEDRLVPLSNDRSNVLLANRWFDLKIREHREKLDYVRFYYSVCRAEGRDKALNIPITIDDVHVSPTVTPEQKAAAAGAIWRYLDERQRTSLAVKFEEIGLYRWQRHRAYVPAQFDVTLYDLEFKIWARDESRHLQQDSFPFSAAPLWKVRRSQG